MNRRINGKRFVIIPALAGIYRCRDANVTIIKSAQVMISEYLVNAATWVPATGQGERGNALYVFPRERQAKDFSQARIDKAISESPEIARLVERPSNVMLKKIGGAFLYIRGAQTREGLLSVDADLAVCDEIAQFEPDIIDLVQKRLGSSQLGWTRTASTPRYPSDEAGMVWNDSTQSEWCVPCPACGTRSPMTIELLDPEQNKILCPHCGADMTGARLGEGEWVPAFPGKTWTGFHLTKLVSPLTNLPLLSQRYLRVLEGRETAGKLQEFWNSEAGLAHLPEGGHLSVEMLNACCDPAHTLSSDAAEGDVVMGVDVGSRLHVRINRIKGGKVIALAIIAVRDFEELDQLMARYHVRFCVIDANPETRKATEFVNRWPRRAWIAYYPNFGDGREEGLCIWKDDERIVHIRRTTALDRVQAQVINQVLVLPHDGQYAGGDVDRSGIGEYYRHMQSPIRVVEEDTRGNPVARYERNGADHYAHAEVYALIAGSRVLDQEVGGVSTARPNMEPALRTDAAAVAAQVLAEIRREQSRLTAQLRGMPDPLGEDTAGDEEIGGIYVAGGVDAANDPLTAIRNRYLAETIMAVDPKEDLIEQARITDYD